MKYIYALRETIEELIRDKNAYVIGEDVMEPYGGAFKVTKGLSEKYPENIIGVPMSEQGFTAVSVGMALMGEYVIEEIMFGDFITLTADQLVNHAAKFYELYGQKQHLVVRTPSGAYRGYGATHSQSLEKIFLGIPGLKVLAANIYCDVGELLKKAINAGVPTLFIENKLDYPKEMILDSFDIFTRSQQEGKIKLSIKGEQPECTIISYGGIASLTVETAKTLMLEDEIAVDVLLITDLSNLTGDWEHIVATNNVVIVEEGTGGFGVSSQLSYELSKCQKKSLIVTSEEYVIPSAHKAENDVLVQVGDIRTAVMKLIDA